MLAVLVSVIEERRTWDEERPCKCDRGALERLVARWCRRQTLIGPLVMHELRRAAEIREGDQTLAVVTADERSHHGVRGILIDTGARPVVEVQHPLRIVGPHARG